MSQKVKDWPPGHYHQVSPTAYISGIKTSASKISYLKLTTVNIGRSTGIITLTFHYRSNKPLDRISFSYLLWYQSIPLPTSSFNPPFQQSTAAYQYVGLISISSSGFSFDGKGFGGSGTSI